MRVVNLLATLDDPRLSQSALHHALEELDARGVYVYREPRTPERILAWIDAEFGGTWSSEAAAGGVWIAQDALGPVGFCVYDPHGLRFRWLRAWKNEAAVGVFGPLGVAARARKRGIGRVLMQAALFSLRERAYREALVPVVQLGASAYYQRYASARIVEEFELDAARPYRTTVLASGNGTNFQAVLEGARSGALPIGVTRLVANVPDARAVERATDAGIATTVCAWNRRAETRANYDERLIAAVTASDPELVLLLGWMHVLSPAFVARFAETLNVHPAFLPLDPAADDVTLPDGSRMPAYRGARALDDALAAGEAWAGATVHRVGIEVDRGAVLARVPLPLIVAEPRERLNERLHAHERRVIATAIRRWSYEQ